MKKLRLTALFTASIGIMCLIGTAQAASKVSGKLSGGNFKGYSVLAYYNGGESTLVKLSSNSFSFTPKFTPFSLHLLSKESRYLGPIVAATCNGPAKSPKCKTSKLATMFKAAKLGSIKFKSGFGLISSFTSISLYNKAIDKRFTIKSIKGKPAGAGNLGFTTAATPGPIIPPPQGLEPCDPDPDIDRDSDKDGVPNPFDIDRDGDGILNANDPEHHKGGSDLSKYCENQFLLTSSIVALTDQTLNRATTPTKAQYDELAKATHVIKIVGLPNPADKIELYGNGLPYCSSGGPAVGLYLGLPFPDGYDADHNGKGEISRQTDLDGTFRFYTKSGIDKVSSGDVIFQDFSYSGDGSSGTYLRALEFVHVSNPVLKSVTAVGTQTIDYSLASGRLGSTSNCIPVSRSRLTLDFWPAQRRGIPGSGEPEIVDMGKSTISISAPYKACSDPSGLCADAGTGAGDCRGTPYTTDDPNLTIGSNILGAYLTDNRSDAPASTTNTAHFTVNVDSCLAAGFYPDSWEVGESLILLLASETLEGDRASQVICFRRI